MRTINDCTYQEYKEGVIGAFNMWKRKPYVWTPQMCTDRMVSDEFENATTFPLVETSEFLFFLSIGEYEIRHDILEERIRNGLSYHIYRYENMSKYKADLTSEEVEEVDKDVAYVKSKIELPEMVSYADKDYWYK